MNKHDINNDIPWSAQEKKCKYTEGRCRTAQPDKFVGVFLYGLYFSVKWVRPSSPAVDKILDGLREHEEGGGGCGEDDLQAQQGVHLPQEI